MRSAPQKRPGAFANAPWSVAPSSDCGHSSPLVYFGVLWRARTRLDDSLDVVAAHGLGGTVGALMTGVLAQRAWGSPADGLLFGNPSQLLIQLVAIVAVIAFSAAGTAAILVVVGMITPVRATVGEEGIGLDVSQHGEEAYGRGEGAVLVLRPRFSSVPGAGERS